MKPINQNTLNVASAGALDSISVNIQNIHQQISVLINPGSFIGTYVVEGNLGLIDNNYAQDYTTTFGQVLVDPNGWFSLTGLYPVDGQTILGYGDLMQFTPLAFIRVNVVSVDTAGSLNTTVLQQGIQ